MTSNELYPSSLFSNLENASEILSLNPASVLWQGKKMLNFASHDYLGLSQHSDLKKSAMKSLLNYGTGLCFGEAKKSIVEYQQQIQEKYSEVLGIRELSFFSSRWIALSMLFLTLRSDDGLLLIDHDCDPLLQYAAYSWHGKIVLFDSADTSALSNIFQQHISSRGPKLLVTESLLSLTGKYCELNPLFMLAKKYDAWVLVDASNAFGIQGPSGYGHGYLLQATDFLLCSLDRAFGSSGAFLSSHLKMNLMDLREGSLPYSSLGAIDTALDQISLLEGERKQLEQRCHWLRSELKALNFKIPSNSHIFCFSFPDKKSAHNLWKNLAQRQILTEEIDVNKPGIDHYLIRFTINIHHTPEDLGLLISSFKEIYGKT